MTPAPASVLSRALRGRFVLAEVMDDDAPDPHPDLVLAQRPTNSQLVEAVATIGMFADGSYLSGDLRVSLLTL
jgi:hypothetical protein